MIKIPHNSGPGIVVGIPTLGRPVNLKWAMSLKSMTPPINYNCVFQITEGQAIDVARNNMAKYAIEVGAKYLFFLGDDVVCPGYTLRQLIFRMEQDSEVGVVGGVYCAKCDPPAPLVFRGNGLGSYWDWKIGEYFEVTGLGMDCTLIRVACLADLADPYFKTVETDQFLDGINNAESWTEDLYFFNQLSKSGKWKVMCDSFVMCEHFDIYTGRVYSLPAESLPMRRKVSLKEKKCLVLGPGDITIIDDLSEYDITRASHEENTDYRVSYEALPFDSAQFDKVIVMPGTHVPETEIQRVSKVA
jgi:hypothetical protein